MQKIILTQKPLTQKQSQTFNVNQAGLTAIFISARCKKKDKFKTEIAGFSFDRIFNGAKLKGLKQTAVFVLRLEAGEHQLNLMPQGNPIIEEVKILEFGENTVLNFDGLEEQAEDGDRRPFYAFVIINQEIKSCAIDASVTKRLRDSDDIKIKVDGREQLNIVAPTKSKSKWRFWLWIGGLKERLQNKTYRESKTIELNLTKGNHLLEIIADRMPILHRVNLILIKPKRIPSVDDPKWTGDFADDNDQMLLARAIFGEARSTSRDAKIAVGWSIRNRLGDPRWANNYHGVILQPAQYSAFADNDPNYLFVTDPLHTNLVLDKQAWNECYEIAGQVLNNQITDSTNGSNHYYSTGGYTPSWISSGELRLEIDNFRFYYIGTSRGQGGFIYLLLLPLLGLFLSGGAILYLFHIDNSWIVDWYSVSDDEKEIVVSYYNASTHEDALRFLTNDGYYKSNLKISPDEKKLGYFQFLHKQGEPEPIDVKDYYDNYFGIQIMDIVSRKKKLAYKGSYKTSRWEWIDNEQVRVYYNCGTACRSFKDININTGKATDWVNDDEYEKMVLRAEGLGDLMDK